MQLNVFSPVWFPSWIFTWCGKAPVTFVALQWLFPSRIFWWYFKSLDNENLLPHSVQLNGFSPVWFPLWIFTWCGKAPVTFGALQWLFPSWILWYYLKSLWETLATLNALVWLLSSVIPFMNLHLMWKSSCNIWCTSMVHCIVCLLHGSSDITSSFFEKLLPHLMHLYGLSPVWFLSWIVTWD